MQEGMSWNIMHLAHSMNACWHIMHVMHIMSACYAYYASSAYSAYQAWHIMKSTRPLHDLADHGEYVTSV